jgi:hypothetical protein
MRAIDSQSSRLDANQIYSRLLRAMVAKIRELTKSEKAGLMNTRFFSDLPIGQERCLCESHAENPNGARRR